MVDRVRLSILDMDMIPLDLSIYPPVPKRELLLLWNSEHTHQMSLIHYRYLTM